jgi:alkylation response protein AidB-like acyl-CoA dehydrogenase
MAFTYTEEQEALRALVRDLCGDDARNRAVAEGGEAGDPTLWNGLRDAGLLTLGIPEGRGGAGGGVVDQSLVAQELGRVASPAPFVTSTMMAGRLLARATTHDEVVAAMAAGVRVACVLDQPEARTVDNGLVSGSARLVIDGHVADSLVLTASAPEGIVVGLVDPAEAEMVAHATVDRGRPLATVTFDNTPIDLLGGPGEGWEEVVAEANRAAQLGLAAESAGLAQRCLDLAREYALTRRQFGEIIGQFQAVKHRLADMLVLAENAVAAVQLGAFALDGNGDDIALSVAAAKATATDAAVQVAGDAMQVHGGIAITWEHDLHLYLRRAKTNQQLLGEPTLHREAIAARLLEQPLQGGPPGRRAAAARRTSPPGSAA